MKAREFFKKVEAHNEIAEMIDDKKCRIIYSEGITVRAFLTYEEFKKWVKEEYIPEVAKAILSFDWYENEKEVIIYYTPKWEDDCFHSVKIEMFVGRAWM